MAHNESERSKYNNVNDSEEDSRNIIKTVRRVVIMSVGLQNCGHYGSVLSDQIDFTVAMRHKKGQKL